jgi:hypothetical protein
MLTLYRSTPGDRSINDEPTSLACASAELTSDRRLTLEPFCSFCTSLLDAGAGCQRPQTKDGVLHHLTSRSRTTEVPLIFSRFLPSSLVSYSPAHDARPELAIRNCYQQTRPSARTLLGHAVKVGTDLQVRASSPSFPIPL